MCVCVCVCVSACVCACVRACVRVCTYVHVCMNIHVPQIDKTSLVRSLPGRRYKVNTCSHIPGSPVRLEGTVDVYICDLNYTTMWFGSFSTDSFV